LKRWGPATLILLSAPWAAAQTPAPAVSSSPAPAISTPSAVAPAAAVAVSTAASAATFSWRKEENRAFSVGESILYTVKYGFIPSGFASLEVKSTETVKGRAVYYIQSTAKTNKATDVFFKVRDKNESWMDMESLCSHRFAQSIREGFYHKETLTEFDQTGGRFSYSKKRKGKGPDFAEGDIPAFIQDVLSSLYYIRAQPLEVGKSYEFAVNSGGKTWNMNVHIRRTQKISVKAGKFDCFKIEPVLAGEGIFQNEGKLEVWVTRDEKKIPVLLRSRVAVGAFDAEMREYSPGGKNFSQDVTDESPPPESEENGG
jgi:hypothetical protein